MGENLKGSEEERNKSSEESVVSSDVESPIFRLNGTISERIKKWYNKLPDELINNDEAPRITSREHGLINDRFMEEIRRSSDNTELAVEINNRMSDFQVKMNRRTGIPLRILALETAVRSGYSEWTRKRMQNFFEQEDENEPELEIKDREFELHFLRELLSGNYPEDWMAKVADREYTLSEFWGHNAQGDGNMLRVSSEGGWLGAERPAGQMQVEELEKYLIEFATKYYQLGPSVLGVFFRDRGIGSKEIAKVAEEIDLKGMLG